MGAAGNFSLTRFSLVTSLVLVVLSAFSPALATRIRPANLEELTSFADRIFSGRIIEVRQSRDPELDRLVTIVTVRVEWAVKGKVGRTVTFKQLAGPDLGLGRGRGVVGMPTYRQGEKVFLFLAKEGSSGLTTTLGLGQGKFIILEDRKGGGMAVNGTANRYLFKNLSAEATNRLGAVAREWRGRKGIPPETLINMVEALKGKPQQE